LCRLTVLIDWSLYAGGQSSLACQKSLASPLSMLTNGRLEAQSHPTSFGRGKLACKRGYRASVKEGSVAHAPFCLHEFAAALHGLNQRMCVGITHVVVVQTCGAEATRHCWALAVGPCCCSGKLTECDHLSVSAHYQASSLLQFLSRQPCRGLPSGKQVIVACALITLMCEVLHNLLSWGGRIDNFLCILCVAHSTLRGVLKLLNLFSCRFKFL